MPSLSDPATFATVRASLIQKGHSASTVDAALRRRVAQEQAPGAVSAGLRTSAEAFQDIGGLGTPGALQTAGQFQAPPDEEASASAATVRELLAEFERVPEGARGPIAGQFAKRFPGVSAEARTFEKTRAGIAGTLKEVVGETGRLTDQDISRIIGLLPSVTETQEEADLTIQNLKAFLNTRGINIDEEPPQAGAAPSGEEEGVARRVVDFKTLQQQLTQGTPGTEAIRLAEEAQTGITPTAGGAPVGAPEEREVAGTVVGEEEETTAFGLPKSLEAAFPALQILDRGAEPFEKIITTFTSQLDDLLQDQKRQVTEQENGIFMAALEGALPILEFTKIGEGGKITELDRTAFEAAAEVGMFILGPQILSKIGGRFTGISKLADKRKAIAKASNATIDGEKLVADTMNRLKNVSSADRVSVNKNLLQAVDDFAGRKLSISDSVELYTETNKAFTAAGKAGKSAKSAFNMALRDSLRVQMPEEILQITTQMAKRYGLSKNLRRFINPITIGSAVTGTLVGGFVGGAVRQATGQ